MLRSYGPSAWTGASALVLALGGWMVSESGAASSKEGGPPPAVSHAKEGHEHPFGAAVQPGDAFRAAAKPHGHGADGEHSERGEAKREHEIAEIKKLEQSLDELLDSSGDGPGSGGSSGSGGSPGTSGGAGSGSGSSGNASDSQQGHHHHRHGRMRRGMELARLMHELNREERQLQGLENRLQHQLANLQHLERNLKNLHHADRVGERRSEQQARWRRAEEHLSSKGKAGEGSAKSRENLYGWNGGAFTNDHGPAHNNHLGGQANAGKPHTGSPTQPHFTSNTSRSGSRAMSGAYGAGNKIGGGQPSHSSSGHHR